MISNPWLAQFARSWQFTRSLTYDFINVLTEENLTYSPQLEFGTFAKLIRHLGDVQAVYTQALKTGKADFAKKSRRFEAESSILTLEKYLLEEDSSLYDALAQYEGDPIKVLIEWPTTKLSVLQHLFLLPQHEGIHQGQFSLAARQAGIDLPRSWTDNWGL